jgi:hypothetical protein
MYDGLQTTGRKPVVATIDVEQTTLDAQWEKLGFPEVSLIKCDVEGGELGVLSGARELIAKCRPAVLLEWFSGNFRETNQPIDAILAMAEELKYRIYSAPACVPIRSVYELRAQMAFHDNFLLLPERLLDTNG